MGKGPGPFKDMGKSANDLLSKDFKTGQHSTELKTTAPNGVKFTAKGDKKGDSLNTSLTANYVYAKGIESECVLKTDGAASGSIEFDGLVDGLTVKVEGESATTKGALLSAASADVDYKQDMFTLKSHYDFYKGNVALSGVAGMDGFGLGGLCDYSTTKSAVAKYAAAATFKQPEFAVTALMNGDVAKKTQTYTLSYYHKVSGDVEVAAKFDMAGEKVTCGVGSIYKLDKDTTTKAKVDSDGILMLSYKQKLNPSATLTLAGQVDTTKLDATKHKVGLALNLSA